MKNAAEPNVKNNSDVVMRLPLFFIHFSIFEYVFIDSFFILFQNYILENVFI